MRSPADSSATSSSLTILTTCWPADRLSRTSWPMALSRTRATKSLTTLKLTSASSRARRTSRMAASTSASLIRPRPVRLPSVLRNRSLRLSNMVRVGLRRGGDRISERRPGWCASSDAPGSGSVPQASDGHYAPRPVRSPFASALWRNPSFVRVWTAASISIFGSLITRLARRSRPSWCSGRGPSKSPCCAAPSSSRRSSSVSWRAPGSIGCAGGLCSSGRTSGARSCSRRSRSPSRWTS